MVALKILACGDVRGRLTAFLKRLNTINAKAGPFEMVLCVGSFFSDNPTQADQDVLNDIKAGRTHLPVPVYILGPNSAEEMAHYADLGGYEIAENLVYLGTSGCFTTREGLKIAYISGDGDSPGEKPFGISYDRFKALEASTKCGDSNFAGVDVLISSEWPRGVARHGMKPEGVAETVGSGLVSKLAVSLRPRYHFVGKHGCFYERQPYRNHRVLNEAAKHNTRFIALAKVGNPEKRKWIYAFNITPLKTIDRSDLVAQAKDVTDMPYTQADISAGNAAGGGQEKSAQFFYDMNAPMEDNNKKKRRHNDRDGGQQPRKKQPQGPCWFCLSGAEVEKHLVVSVGDHSYLALPKGGLNPEHILILPIAHYPSLLELPQEVEDEVNKFKSALKKCFKKQGKATVIFERNYKSQHLQLQVVPIPKEAADSTKTTFLEEGENQDIELLDVPEHSSLTQMTQPGAPYFYVELPNRVKLFHRIRSGFPIQFGREVAAGILEVPERVDWRECKVDRAEEVEMTKAFRKMFTPFDFTLEDEEGND